MRDGSAHVLRCLKVWYDLPSDVFHTALANIDTFLAKMKVKNMFYFYLCDYFLLSLNPYPYCKNRSIIKDNCAEVQPPVTIHAPFRDTDSLIDINIVCCSGKCTLVTNKISIYL